VLGRTITYDVVALVTWYFYFCSQNYRLERSSKLIVSSRVYCTYSQA
jgi:hypothetical protein